MRYLPLALFVLFTTGCGETQAPPLPCANFIKDGSETDVDCGGPMCAPCIFGRNCAHGSDCESSVCLNNECQPPTCDDQIKNGSEVDTDCGGEAVPDAGPHICAPCGDGAKCTGDLDCKSQICLRSGTCGPNLCDDKVKDNQETDVDCGGKVCPRCPAGKMCLRAEDCQSHSDGGVSGECFNNVCK